ncbi:MAG: ATPase, T2SS/T4P/T4SS family [Pirellulaceae bacterium]|nr:ATPase, T2SS/T4P/T4SS family [Pirellulaceae bacterium]
MGLFGGGKAKNKKKSNAEEQLPPLELKPTAFDRNEAQGVLVAARQLPGYPIALNLLALAMNSRADRILMDYSAQGVAVRSRIDGIWEAMAPMDRPSGDAALVVIKKIWGLNPNERRAKQEGKCAATFLKGDWIVTVLCQGTANGERVLVSVDPKKPILKTLSDLGMRDKMQEKFKALLNGHGLVLFTAAAGHGLPTSWRVGLDSADRFMRDWISLESKSEPEPEMINITQNFFDPSQDEKPEAALYKVLLKQPDVMVMPSLYNEAVVDQVLHQLKVEGKHGVTRIVANDPIEAVLVVLTTYRGKAKELLEAMSGVLSQKLVRRLCESCRQTFQPSPQLLQKLGIPAGRISQLYQPYIPPPPEQRVDAKGNPIEIPICTKCNGRGYFGRVAIFELLELTPEIKQAILKYAKTPDTIRQVAKKAGHVGFQDEAIISVATGLTSLQEMQRIMQGK